MTSVAVVGGGIAGLAAAWELCSAGAEVTVFEAGDRFGGRVRTEPFRGRLVEQGPDAFLARPPHHYAVELCRQLGLDDQLVAPAAEGAWLWAGGRLRTLPAGTVLGAPVRLRTVASSRALSPAGLARAALDLALPARRVDSDISVGALVRARFGDEVFERLVDPLVGGVHAGPADQLSARAVAPQLVAAARAHRSLLRGLRAQSRRPDGATGTGPVFLSLRGGLAVLLDALVAALRKAGARLELGAELNVLPGDFEAVVLATPAATTAGLVARGCPDAAAELAAIDHASVVLTTLAYPATAFPAPRPGTGFLVPAAEGRLLTACSFGSAKWPHWAAGGEVVLRASAGRRGDERALGLGDDELVEALHAELTEALGLTAGPLEARVARWPVAFPQYDVGHLDRVARIEAALARDLPRVQVAGASYRGVGLPACIASGRAAAGRILARC